MRFVFLSLVVLSQAAALPQKEDAASALLRLGARQYREGDFEAAVFSLDSAVRKLADQPGRENELARAYVYLGAAYVGLDHEAAAKGKFRRALELDPGLDLAPADFSQRVIRLFESQRLRQTAEKKRKGTKIALIVGGLGAAAAVGISAATSGGPPPNRPPTVDFGVTPEGIALAGVTLLTFRASASDPDGDPLTYRWTFGDGASGTGPEVTHRFDREGTFVVEASAEDGRGGSGKAQRTLSPGSLKGVWWESFSGVSPEDQSIECTQTGASFDCRLILCRGSCTGRSIQRAQGTLAHPRLVFGNVEYVDPDFAPDSFRNGPCTGEVRTDLNEMRCGETPTLIQMRRK